MGVVVVVVVVVVVTIVGAFVVLPFSSWTDELSWALTNFVSDAVFAAFFRMP